MVNIQDNNEFASHRLNSELWSNTLVKEVVKDNFVFMQVR